MTAIMASEAGLKIDMNGCEKCMDSQREQSRAGSSFAKDMSFGIRTAIKDLEKESKPPKPTSFMWDKSKPIFEVKTKIQFWSHNPEQEDGVALVIEKTPFYVEAGGQTGDIGMIVSGKASMIVSSVINHQDISHSSLRQ